MTAGGTRRICRTPEEAFEAGLTEPCEHGAHVAVDCERCRLTAAEIGQLAVLLQSCLRPAASADIPAA